MDLATRLRSNTLFGAGGRVAYTFDQTNGDIPIVNFGNPIDLNDHDAFTTTAFARRQAEEREDEITALRLDANYDLGDGWLESIQAGVRVSDHNRITDLSNDNNLETIPALNATSGNANCRIDNVVENWGEDSNTNIHTWAQFDTLCLYEAFTGSPDLGPVADPRSVDDLEINERIYAAYAMASFQSEWAGVPFSGNFGVRFVQTDVTSLGYRGAFTLVTNPGPPVTFTLQPVAGTFDDVEIEHDYLNVLPSFNIAFELTDNLMLRGAIYQAIARSNIEHLGAGRTLITDAAAATPEEALAGASGGNPRLEPLESTNLDVSLEYYPSPDTSYSFTVYHKDIQAAARAAEDGALEENFVIDGVSYTVPVAQQINSGESSYLAGFEIAINHSFSNLPAPFDGFGIQGSYNYNDTDFEYPDPSAVDPLWPLADFTDPASIPGLSRHVGAITRLL